MMCTSQQFTVVGVHSAKFDNEKDLEAIRNAVLRYNISHPVSQIQRSLISKLKCYMHKTCFSSGHACILTTACIELHICFSINSFFLFLSVQ